MTRAKPRKKSTKATSASKRMRISEDWLATGLGIAIILLIRFSDLVVKWPLFEWFKK